MPQGKYYHHNTMYTVFPVLGALGELTVMIDCGSIHFAVVDTVRMAVLRFYRPTGPQLPGTMYLTYRLTLSQVSKVAHRSWICNTLTNPILATDPRN